jgi:hypothetical protein
MEEVLARPFFELNAETYKVGGNSATAVKDPPLSDVANATDRRVVVIYQYDPDAADKQIPSPVDKGLLYVRVYYETEGSANALNTLVGRWW